MNKNAIKISEHLLAKFLDGKTDDRETELVLAYLNENNENLKEFLNIRAAIVNNTDCPVEIDLTESLHTVKQHISSSQKNKKTVQKRFYLITSFAAAAMVAGVVSLIAFYYVKNDTRTMAQTETTKEKTEETTQDDDSEIFTSEKQIIENKNLANNETKKVDETVGGNEEETEVQVQIEQHQTAAKTVGNQFEMLRPAKTPYVVAVRNLSKTFDFQYNTNAEKMEVVIKDKKGNILLNREISQDGLQLKYEDWYKYLELHWELKATFKDGAVDEKQGILQMLID